MGFTPVSNVSSPLSESLGVKLAIFVNVIYFDSISWCVCSCFYVIIFSTSVVFFSFFFFHLLIMCRCTVPKLQNYVSMMLDVTAIFESYSKVLKTFSLCGHSFIFKANGQGCLEQSHGQEFCTIWRRHPATSRWIVVLAKKKQGRDWPSFAPASADLELSSVHTTQCGWTNLLLWTSVI